MVIGYNDLLVFVQSILPQMRLTRQRNLALVVVGLLQVRDAHLTVAEIARAIPSKTDHWHKFKRLWRFLSNVKWSPTGCCQPLLRFVLARFRVGQYLPIIVDQSTLAGKWEVLWASIPFRGRALPIYFTLFRYADISHDPEGSQNKIEHEFIQAVVDLIPTTHTPLLLFDRGYARVSLLQFLATLPVKYVIRARKNVLVRYRRHFVGLLSQVPIHRGQLLWWPKALYHQEAAYPVNLAISWSHSADEPWYLLTNLRRSDTTVHWYERRFRCEELFKDIKDQLHLETIRLKKQARVERLMFALIVAYYALTLVGVAAQSAGLRPKVCRDPVSPAWMALRLLKMPFIFKARLARRALLRYFWSLNYESG